MVVVLLENNIREGTNAQKPKRSHGLLGDPSSFMSNDRRPNLIVAIASGLDGHFLNILFLLFADCKQSIRTIRHHSRPCQKFAQQHKTLIVPPMFSTFQTMITNMIDTTPDQG